MKKQQDQQSNENKSESPALNETGGTTSRQVQREAAGNTSHPGRPGLDELVPSRYALKVGEIECWWSAMECYQYQPRFWHTTSTRPC
jgi:hypothetical protein